MFHTLWVASGIAETAYKTDNPSPVPTRIVSPFSLQEECDKMEKHYMDFKEAYVRAQKTSELDTEVVRGGLASFGKRIPISIFSSNV